MTPIKPPESNPLMLSIHDAFVADPTADGVHVSIEPHAREMKGPDGSPSYVKAVCWNLTKGGEDASGDDPELLVVDEDHNEDTVRADVEKYFKGCRCVVDNDILIEEDD